MLSHRRGAGLLKASEVEPFLRHAAATREGEWEVVLYETMPSPVDRQGQRFPAVTKIFVRFTEAEMARFSQLVLQPLRNGTKDSTLFANLEQAAATAYPTGSVEHIAMRHLAPIAMFRYWTAAESTKDRDWSHIANKMVVASAVGVAGSAITRRSGWAPGWGVASATFVAAACFVTHTFWRERDDRTGLRRTKVEEMVVGNDGTPPTPIPACPVASGPPPTLAPDSVQPAEVATVAEPAVVVTVDAPLPVPRCAPIVHGGADADHADTNANADLDGRTITMPKGTVAIIGQEYDKTIPHERQPIMGALLGPCTKPPNVYSKTLSNLQEAIRKRILEKQKGNTMSGNDMKRIGRIISAAIGQSHDKALFSETRIRRWAEENFQLEEIKSKKWSVERLRQSLVNLYKKTDVDYAFKAGLKPEDMKEGKAPRMLIADGDEGQLMALVVIKCFEDLLFDWFEEKSIKHASKKSAMKRIFKNLSKAGGAAVEGDGTAWDTTCGSKIRGAVENPILRHIMEVLITYGIVPESWHQAHTKACEAKELKLFYKDKYDTIRITIDAIRRSGHRGTSCLNWWINFVMWVTSIFPEPERFLDPKIRSGVDVTGIRRWWNGVFEGDDSLCVLCPPMVENDKLSVKFLNWWYAGGFDMKIVFCTDRATVVGWHIACDKGALTSVMSPELPRAMASSGVGVSASTAIAAREDSPNIIKTVAAASAMARAGDFAGILPTVSNKYYVYSRSLTTAELHDDEMSYRVYGEKGHSSSEMERMIELENLRVTPSEELATMRKLGYATTPEELDRFILREWSLAPEVLTDYEGFKQSLPLSWRGG
jgi:hypothetical protein